MSPNEFKGKIVLVNGAAQGIGAAVAQAFSERDRQWRPMGSRFDMEAVPAPTAYVEGVNKALGRLRSGELDKIVLARTLRLTSPQPINLQQLLHNLSIHNTHGYTFAVDLTNGQSV